MIDVNKIRAFFKELLGEKDLNSPLDANNVTQISSQTIYMYLNYGFYRDDYKWINKVNNTRDRVLSPASSFFNKVCNMQASVLYSRFPEYSTNNQAITEFIENNKKELDSIFKDAVFNYVAYGKAYIKLNKELKLESISPCEFETNENADYVAFTNKLSVELDHKLKIAEFELNKDTTKLLTDNKVYLSQDNKNIFMPKQGMFVLDELNSNNNAISCKPFIVDVEALFYKLENFYYNYLESLNGLRTNFIVPKALENEINQHFKANFTGIKYSINTGNLTPNINPKDLVAYIDNSGVIQSLVSYKEQLELLKQQILELSNSESLYNPSLDDNPSETRIAAQDRVNRSTTAWQSKQSKVNNYIEYILKKYLSLNLGIKQEEIELELDSVSILEQEQKEVKNNAIQGQILALCDKIVQLPSVELVALHKTVIDNLINKSSLPNAFKQSVEDLVASVVNNLQAMQQDPNAQAIQQKQAQIQDQAIALDLAKKQADIEKTQSETQENIAQTKQMQVEASLKPNELAYKQQEQNQQDLDTAIKLEELETKKQESFLSKLNPFKRR